MPPMADPQQTWATRVPELGVSDFAVSLGFYTELLGFRLCHARPGFAYLERERVQIMLEDIAGAWSTAPADHPFGRSVNPQIEASNVATLYEPLRAANWPMFRDISESWYRAGDSEHGQRECPIQNPDGYLSRFAEPLGERPAPDETPA